MLDFVRFAIRNPSYAVRHARQAWATRKAMNWYRLNHPACEYCGRSKQVDVHHIVPVSIQPSLAADPSNLMTLCRKPACHQTIGHDGDFRRRFVDDPKALCKARRAVLVVEE